MKTKSFWLDLVFKIAIGGLAIYIGFDRLPKIWTNYQLQGLRTESLAAPNLEGVRLSVVDGQRRVLLFWATWCGPCGIEIDRLKSAAREGKIRADQVLLVSLSEEPSLVSKVAKERDYPFELRFDQNGEMANTLMITVTPTVVFVDEASTIQWVSAGLSPSLIWRAEEFLK